MSATALETLDWLVDEFAGEYPQEVDRVKRAIYRDAAWAWISRQIEGELPPPIPQANNRPVIRCAWCFEPLGEMRSDFNGATGHPECARFAYEAVVGDDPMPWPIPEPYRHDPLIPFCRRLGREAARLGIDRQQLLKAIGRARCA